MITRTLFLVRTMTRGCHRPGNSQGNSGFQGKGTIGEFQKLSEILHILKKSPGKMNFKICTINLMVNSHKKLE